MGPRIVHTKPIQPLAKTEYKAWETEKVGQVFAVTLNVSPFTNCVSPRLTVHIETKGSGNRLVPLLAQGPRTGAQ